MNVQKGANSFLTNLERLRIEKAKSILFTHHQRKVIEKVINLEHLNSRESQLFSRRIKPKINAVIDYYSIAIVVRSRE